MKNSLKRTTLLVSVALLAPTLARPVHAEDFVFDSHTAINGIMPSYSEKGSNDIKSFSDPESSITLDWTNIGTDTGLPRSTGISPIFNAPEVTAKNITVIVGKKGNQWNDKGIIYDNKQVTHGKITASGTIMVKTYDDCIYMNSPAHTVDITGFKKLIFNSSGMPTKGSSGYAIMNNGIDNYLNIIGGENSEIEMTNTGRRAVVADNSSTAESTKTTITANSIYLHANGSSAIVQTKTHNAFTGGQIEINGIDKTIITNEKDGGTAVSAQASRDGKGLIEINKRTSGVVEITGAVTASNGTADIDFAGDQSFLKGNMTSSGEKGKILADFKGADSQMTGDMKTSNTAAIDAAFSGKNASMMGDITAAGNSTVTSVFSGKNTSFTGNIDTTKTSQTGQSGSSVESSNNSTVTADFSGSGASYTGDLASAGTSKANIALTNHGLWKGKAATMENATTAITLSNGSRWDLTANSNVSSLDLSSGATASLAGDAHSLDVGTLSASGASGIFEMDLAYHDNKVDTYENATDSDFLYAHGGTGSSFTVQPTAIASVDAMKSGDKLYFAQVKEGAAAFKVNQDIKLQNKNSLFDSTLSVKKETDTEKTDYEDWFITPVGDGKTPNLNAFTPGSAHHAAVSIWRESDTLLKRLGELRYNQEDQGLWARYINNKLNWDGRNNFDTTMKTLQVGYDKKETGTKRDWYYGGAIEHTWGSSEYAGCGDGKQHLTDIALYATQIGNKGHYLDLVTKVGYLSSDYKTTYGDSADFDNWAFSAGAEYGRKKALGNEWFVEPQAQLTYYFLKGDNYTTKNGAIVNQDNTDNLVGRLGAVLTKEYDKETRNPKRFYVKASVQHDFLGDRSQHLQQNGMSYYDSNDFRDTWYTVGIGTNVHFDDKYAFYFDAEKNFGADLKSKYRVEVGLRYEF